jgi:DNA-binding MarR family transcriptional regulator
MAVEKGTVRDFRRALRLIERELSLELDSETSCCGVSLSQCHLLLELEIIGEVSLSGLADATGLDKSTLSRTVESLVKEGLVQRDTSPDDRRGVRILLSDKGKKKAELINGYCDKYYDTLFSRIPATKHASIIQSLSVLADAMREMHSENKFCSPDRCKIKE